MDEDRDWKEIALEKQMQFFETLGCRPYDEIEKNNLFLLKKKVGFATCGKPSKLPDSSNFFTGYSEGDLLHIKSICDKIIEKSVYDPIRFACTVLVLYHKNAICETSVFRICSDSGNIFIDVHGRVYQDWKQFMEENILPDCEYCYPHDGKYSAEGEALVGFAFSPASSILSKTTDCLDTAGTVASVAAASVFAAGSFFAVAPVALTAATTVTLCSGLYSVTRSAKTLYDRHQHEQSVGLKDPESRSAWMSVGSSIVGLTTINAIEQAKKVVESGKSLSKLSVVGLHALTASSLVFSGFGFVDTLVICVGKYKKGILTQQDVFDLSCELLFLFNAIASARATAGLVNSMSAAASEPSVQRKLTKTQKRNLRKRAAKRKAKGLSSTNNSESSNPSGFSATISLLLLEAVQMYAPRVQEILYNVQSISHDIISWKNKEMSDFVFMRNIFKSGLRLYNDYIDEISEAITKVIKYFSTFDLNMVMEKIYKLFATASEELKTIFCTKVINMEDQIETLISDAEAEVTDLHEQLGLEAVENMYESIENSEDPDEDNLNSETQKFLSCCGSIIELSSWPCRDLEEFHEVLDGVKYVVISEFKTKVSEYKNALEAAKAGSGESFNVNAFNKTYGINGDVGQHMFSKVLQSLTAERCIYKVKTKCKEIQKERNARTNPIWEGINDGIFHFFGPHGTGELSKPEILSLVGGMITEVDISENNCKVLEENDTMMIEVTNNGQDINFVVYQGVTEENTASGIIIVVK